MKKLRSLLVLVAAAFTLASCGGGDDGTILSPGGGGTVAEVGSVQIIANSTQLPSDQTGASTVTLTIIVRDANNNALDDVPVSMSVTSGQIIPPAPTDASGTTTAQLSNGLDPTNRTITVSATAGASGTSAGVTTSIDIVVVGTTLVITGPSALALNNTGQYTAVLKDSEGVGIGASTVTFTSANGNSLSPPSVATNSSGDATTTLTAGTPGAGNSDTLTASALGLTATATVSISGDAFGFISPAAGTEVNLGVPQVVEVRWLQNGAPVPDGSVVQFSSTRGTVSGVTATSGGIAQATLTSTTAGSAVVTARDPATNTTATLNLEFVATTPATLDLQASPFTVPVDGQSALTAVVRDANQQLVKNASVQFQIISDTSGSPGVSPGTDLTDSLGTAQSFYTAGPNSTAQNGVKIRASAIGSGGAVLAFDEVDLTVAQQALFISLGTGNDIFEPTTASFAKEWNIIVTDSVGNAVANKPVQVSLNSTEYRKGQFLLVSGAGWTNGVEGVNYLRCPDEDLNRNGILDLGEDLNTSGRLEAGNVATVAAVPSGAPASNPCATAGAGGTSAQVTTNTQGLARVCVIYPQDHNLWVKARIEAKASVSGTEFARSQEFLLDAKAEDLNNENASPPGQLSPFGTALDCSNTL
ncbi:MAG: Ig-like domain-containing protein [Gammaproteobacteria bacterium]|nr:Ig-like domain-containing protein [Gammaproteobacteria bacterium]